MLYVTTRNNRDAFTVQHALKENRAADGGLYLPFKAPVFTQEEMDALLEKPFNQCVADMLNMLFNTNLCSWDIDFCVGRYPVRLKSMGHRTFLAESWHNPDWNFERMVQDLSDLLYDKASVPSNWTVIAVRISVLFGVFAELHRSGIESADVSLVSGDFSGPISAWYARQWGLPMGNIVCCCNENNNLWEFLCHGQMRTDVLSVPTIIPEADITLPTDLERLIYECGGVSEVERYTDACRKGATYCPDDQVVANLRNGLFVSVVSSHRIKTMIPNVYKTHDYLLSPYSAFAYAGLMDYRTKTGVTRHAIVMSEKSPICDIATVADAMDMTSEELKRMI